MCSVDDVEYNKYVNKELYHIYSENGGTGKGNVNSNGGNENGENVDRMMRNQGTI